MYPGNLPEGITEPTGEIRDLPTNTVIDLGLVKVEQGDYVFFNPDNGFRLTLTVDFAVVSGRLARAYSAEAPDPTDGRQTVQDVFLDLVVGEYSSGGPFIVSFRLGRTTQDGSFSLTRDDGSETIGLDLAPLADLFDPETQYGRIFQPRLDRHAQVTLRFPVFGDDDLAEVLRSYPRLCETSFTHEQCTAIYADEMGNLDVNERLVEILQDGAILSPQDEFADGDFVTGAFYVEFYTR